MVIFLTPYIILNKRSQTDRLGAQILSYICQIIFAHYNNYYIDVQEDLYANSSIFIKTIKKYIDFHNSNKIKINTKRINLSIYTYQLHFQLLKLLKCDIFTYFKNNLSKKFAEIFDEYKYDLPFDPKKHILIHLRLDDLNENTYYDGKYNNNFLCDIVNDLSNVVSLKGIDQNLNKRYKLFLSENTDYIYVNNNYNHVHFFGQSAIQEEIIEELIGDLKKKYNAQDDDFIIIASPKGTINLKYKVIRSIDPDLDLYYLCNCNKVILSRSTYSLSSLFFNSTENLIVHVPYFNIATSLGLTTNYDLSNYIYYN